MSIFQSLELMPGDPILSLFSFFALDDHPQKVNLGVGAYRDSEGNPKILSSVEKAERIISDKRLNKEYLPIDGSPLFNQATQKLIFGDQSKEREILTIQTIGASGALYVGAVLLSRILASGSVYLPMPTWPNHHSLLRRRGLIVNQYPYFNEQTKAFDHKNFIEELKKMPKQSIVLLHGCCHNPTGVEPSEDEWKEISLEMKKLCLIPFFDFAYQGFGESIEKDAKPVRIFAQMGHEMLVANSYSKNFGLYGERIGSLSVVVENKSSEERVLSHLKRIVRACYSTPPIHGAFIVETILNSPVLKKEWENELEAMRQRIVEMREKFVERLERLSGSSFAFLKKQKGFFSYLCLNRDQVLRLRKEFGVYILEDSRINMAGLTEKNVQYISESIIQVL